MRSDRNAKWKRKSEKVTASNRRKDTTRRRGTNTRMHLADPKSVFHARELGRRRRSRNVRTVSDGASVSSQGRILKLSIDGVVFDSQTGKPSLLNPRCLGLVSKSKLKAHSLSRILFHHLGAKVPTMSDLKRRARDFSKEGQ